MEGGSREAQALLEPLEPHIDYSFISQYLLRQGSWGEMVRESANCYILKGSDRSSPVLSLYQARSELDHSWWRCGGGV